MDVPLVGRHVVEHGLKKGKFAIAERKKMKSGSFIYWVRTHWLGAMLWTNQKLLVMLGAML